MSTADLPPVHPGLSRGAGATSVLGTRRDAVRAHHWATARWWAVGVLWVGTLALAAWLVLLVAAGALAAFAIGILRPQTPAELDVAGLVLASLPGLLVGWCVGLAATAALARGEALGPRTAGTVGALVGIVAGALTLRLSGLL